MLCQAGNPFGVIAPNADGDDTPFAVQVLSRFLVSTTLASRRALSPGAIVLSICNTGQNYDALSIDDLNLHRDVGAAWTKFGAVMAQSARDSTVLDAYMLEQNERFKEQGYRFFSMFPGLVKVELFDQNNTFPFPINVLF